MKKRIIVAVVLAVLMAASAHAQATDFFELVKTGTAQDVQAAIDKGADVNALTTQDGNTPLMLAAGYNPDPEVITMLLKVGADIKAVNGYSMTALMFAAKYNQNPEAITTLLNAGAKVNDPDGGGFTPLMFAATRNSTEVITTLLRAGADIKAKNNKGLTPLMFAAAANQNPEVVITLLRADADAKAKDDNGQTAFDYAKNNYRLRGTEALKQLEEASR